MNDAEWENLLASITQAEASSSSSSTTIRPQPESQMQPMIANRFDYFPQHRHPVPHPHEYIEPPPGPELPLNTSLSEQEYFAQFSQSIPPALLPRHLTESSPTHYAIDAGPSQHASSSQLEPQYPSTEAARELAARARAAHERGRARRTTNPPPFPLASGTSRSSSFLWVQNLPLTVPGFLP